MNQRMRRYWAPKETQEFFPNEKWCFLPLLFNAFVQSFTQRKLLVIKIQAFDNGKRSCWRLGTSS
ncbi:unnamed protein product [Larinioides sclopetarius]|uniref:Uncharacterized protein n=1 Tax=Larinioides sclopetarius TaxID=280406 RepID=A0AAV1ZFS0_9ARAC